jgi:hypothetical protein
MNSFRMSKKNSLQQPQLAEDEVLTRLCLNNPILIGQILSHSIKYFDASITGRKDIDEKTNWLLATATGCLTLFFAGITVLLSQPERTFFLGSLFFWSALISVACLFISVLFYFFALRVRSDFKTLSELDILEKDTLAASEQCEKDCPYDSRIYDRYMANHFIDIAKTNFRINEKKGRLVKIGQSFFLGGLLFLTVVAILLSYTLICV